VRAFYPRRFLDHYAVAPPRIQRAVDRRIGLLVQNLRHPSLRAKKYDEAKGIWQARVNGGWRLYFTIEGDLYRLLALIPHPK
jgi:plasmid maintenance system killer protein